MNHHSQELSPLLSSLIAVFKKKKKQHTISEAALKQLSDNLGMFTPQPFLGAKHTFVFDQMCVLSMY